MKDQQTAIENFFFARISASGFGLMRIAWAAVALGFFLMACKDITFLYSNEGILPPELGYAVFRSDYRFTILDYIGSSPGVVAMFCILVSALFLAMIGKWTRCSTILSVVLLFSFHERNLLPLGGGDTVLRYTGFLLAIAPELRAFSVDRLKLHWKQYQKDATFLPPLTMSIWPYRLLLWQLIVLYVTSAWDKASGTMWLNGTAVSSSFHHLHFSRYPNWIMDLASVPSPIFGYFTLIFEFVWLGMLIPYRMIGRVLERHALRRSLILCGIFFHGGIFVFMDVGSFSLAILASYLGLLHDDDFKDIRALLNRKTRNEKQVNEQRKIIVLYDGICRLCRRSMFGLQMMDHLHRLQPADFRNEHLRKSVAPNLKLADLDRAMHILLPNGSTREGFYAFRTLCWHLPSLWLAVPFLYIPGIPQIGERVYAKIAASREKCADGVCRHK